MKVQVAHDGLDGVRELEEVQDERALAVGADCKLAVGDVLHGLAGFSLDRQDAGVGVEEVDGGVALGVEHLIVIELVVGLSVLLQIEISHGAVADLLSRVLEFGLGKS